MSFSEVFNYPSEKNTSHPFLLHTHIHTHLYLCRKRCFSHSAEDLTCKTEKKTISLRIHMKSIEIILDRNAKMHNKNSD